jgi:hypothetical protein
MTVYKYDTFANFTNHKNDFGIAAERHFFDTSHVKGPCDVGSTTKWQTARPNLQHPYDKQTLTPKDFHKFAKEDIQRIKYLYVSEADII